MRIKTSELTGAALDWAVATGLGYTRTMVHLIEGGVRKSRPAPWGLWDEIDGDSSRDGSFHPSSNWAQGGPLIEREGINVYFNPEDADDFEWSSEDRSHAWWAEGPTPLIAAMRCLVAAKLGEEVEIPEELYTT